MKQPGTPDESAPFRLLGRLVAGGFGCIWKEDPGQRIGIHNGQAQGLKGQPIERALASSIAAHAHPQLGTLAQGLR